MDHTYVLDIFEAEGHDGESKRIVLYVCTPTLTSLTGSEPLFCPRPSLILSPYSLQDDQLPLQSFEFNSSFLFSHFDTPAIYVWWAWHSAGTNIWFASPNALCPHSVPNVVLIGC